MTEITMCGRAHGALLAHQPAATAEPTVRYARDAGQLVVDPGVRLLEPGGERRARLPAESLADERVVGVAAAHALGRIEVVAPLEPHAGDLLDDVDELVDRHELGGAEVDRLVDVALHDPCRAVRGSRRCT